MLNMEMGDLQLLQGLLAVHVPHKTVWAYGSRVTGTSHAGSDLDLVVIDPAGKQTNLISLRTAVNHSLLPISVDILDWALIPASFRESIQKAYVVIQEGGVQ